ncbi:MAG: hypothetical protein AAF679_00105 [Pseudomonadota bacterium]
MTTVVEIEALSLDGFTEDEGRRAAAAFEARLTDLLDRHGLPEGRTAQDLTSVDLGSLPSSATTPEGLGRELASALFQRVWL